jgi:hypothetical protein
MDVGVAAVCDDWLALASVWEAPTLFSCTRTLLSYDKECMDLLECPQKIHDVLLVLGDYFVQPVQVPNRNTPINLHDGTENNIRGMYELFSVTVM